MEAVEGRFGDLKPARDWMAGKFMRGMLSGKSRVATFVDDSRFGV